MHLFTFTHFARINIHLAQTERALFARLGLKAKKNGHGSLAVEAVTTGGFVHSWGVGKGMEVAQVRVCEARLLSVTGVLGS